MQLYKFITIMIVTAFAPIAAYADGQGVPINYDNLSFFEEPLAVEIGPATLNTNFLMDQAAQYNSTTEKDTYNTRAKGEFTIETELPNSWQLGATYISEYNRLADNDERDEYTDDVAVFISDEWGTLAGGNVTGSVHENTRRKKGFGNADLANDGFVGELDETGAYYSIRYNSYGVSVTADQEGRAEAGLSFERPIGKSYYRAAARLRKGDTAENVDIAEDGDTYGGALVGQYIYASTLIDAQVGYEAVDRDSANGTNDHVFGSLGMQYKYGAYRVSAEGSLSRYDGQDRRAFALGSCVDIARGASLNFGVNYEYANDDDDTTALSSVRYEF